MSVFLALLLFGGQIFATSASTDDFGIETPSPRHDLVLILGASPFEESVKVSRPWLSTNDSICFLSNAPQTGDASHPRYFNINFNNPSQWESFAARMQGKFKEIYFDWAVFNFFEYSSLPALCTLLKAGGSLFIPEPGVGTYTTSESLKFTTDDYEKSLRAYFQEATNSRGGPLCRIGEKTIESSREIIDAVFIDELTKRINNLGFVSTLMHHSDVEVPLFERVTKCHPKLVGRSFTVLKCTSKASASAAANALH